MEFEKCNTQYENNHYFDNDENKIIFEEYVTKFMTEYINYSKELKSENENEEQIIERLTKQFIFLINAESLIRNNKEAEDITIAIHNHISHLVHVIRDIARNLNMETKLSLKITKEKIMPIHEVLLKHNKHYFEYLDHIEQLQCMYNDINFYDDNLKEAFDTHQLFFTWKDRDMLKALILIKYLMVSGKKKKDKVIEKEARKIDTYMNAHEFVFPLSFCKDVCKVFCDEPTKKKKPNKQKRKQLKLKKQKEEDEKTKRSSNI